MYSLTPLFCCIETPVNVAAEKSPGHAEAFF
jgi:hypothetical protein